MSGKRITAKYNKFEGEKGSFTVELTILFTFIIFVLFAFVFGVMAIYQNMFLQKAVNSAVLFATEAQGFTGDIKMGQSDIYQKVEEEIDKQMGQSIFGKKNFRIITASQAVNEDNMIRVTIEQDVDFPFGAIKQFFSGNDKLTFKASTVAITDNTAQVIRNTDVAVEMAMRSADKLGEALSDTTVGTMLSEVIGL